MREQSQSPITLPIPTYYPILEMANYGENVSQLVGVATNTEEKSQSYHIMESHAHATNDKYEDQSFDNNETKMKKLSRNIE